MKYLKNVVDLYDFKSLPSTGAWIEILLELVRDNKIGCYLNGSMDLNNISFLNEGEPAISITRSHLLFF